jgi:conjugal transfer pilus assembly protein TraD
MSNQSDSLFLGWGKEWGQYEAQVCYDLLKRDIDTIVGKSVIPDDKGKGYIHGLLKYEEVIRYALSLANGHTLITGATGSGKTRFFDLVIKQLILRGETCIFLDPKGDKGIREIAKKTTELIGKPERYCLWHPAFPNESVRLQPLKNFSRSSELAARITALIPDDGDAFYRDISNTVVQYIVDAMLMVNEQVTLAAVRYYYEHFGQLIEKACLAWFDKCKINWRDKIHSRLQMLNDEEARATICLEFYRTKVESEHHESTISSMISMYVEKRRTLEQSTGSLLANLSKVTSGVLDELLSPRDNKDPRPSLDMESVIDDNKVLIIGTDSLTDRIISSALGKMILADAAAVAGTRNNYGNDNDQIINLFVDEASEMLCEPLIQMINKARGSKFRLWVATQTISDFTAEMGSEAKADQIIASTNNFISFRCKDEATQARIGLASPPTKVKYVMRTQGFNGNDEKDGISSNIGERLMEEEATMFPVELMASLPDLEYVASFAGGGIIKGRIPVLV